MLFNSHAFLLVYLPIVLVLFFTLGKLKLPRLATASLVVASLAFYAYWDLRYLPLLLGSIGFNFLLGTRLGRSPDKRTLALAIAGNLALLGYYKYTNFFLEAVASFTGAAGTFQTIVLPLGISFFTFTQIAYLVDAYRGETKGYDLLTYALFVTFFPHLIAGPILYHKDVVPQFKRLRHFVFSHKAMGLGLVVFTLGLFKKVFLADNLSPWAAMIFDHAQEATFVEAWVGALAYTLQLYFDFSGYSEMAIGLGLMLNVKLPENFRSPYKATSIIDFWRRWHITLSAFLRNYLYIPLGGNRGGEGKRMRNLMITMLLGGLWHGAGWTFVIWGGLHGTYLVVNHSWRKLASKLGVAIPALLAWPLTFGAVVFAWVFFRAETLPDALALSQAMLGLKGLELPQNYAGKLSGLPLPGVSFGNLDLLAFDRRQLLVLPVLLLWVACLPHTLALAKRVKPTPAFAVACSAVFLLCLFNLDKVSEFLYFQF